MSRWVGSWVVQSVSVELDGVSEDGSVYEDAVITIDADGTFESCYCGGDFLGDWEAEDQQAKIHFRNIEDFGVCELKNISNDGFASIQALLIDREHGYEALYHFQKQ